MSEDLKENEVLEEEPEKNEQEEIVPEAEIIDEKDEKIEKLEAEIKKWKDDYVRKIAEVENFKKRIEKEKQEFLKYSSEKLLVKTLDVVDNLERAVESSKQSQDFESLVKGVEMTLSQLHQILDSEGVVALESLGKEFNPYEHHAMMQEETDEHENNTVMMELQKGYKMKDKIIRPSLVKVAKKKN